MLGKDIQYRPLKNSTAYAAPFPFKGYHMGMLPCIMLCLLLFVSCSRKPNVYSDSKRREADSIVSTAYNIDSLAQLQEQLERKGDRLGSVVALREWDKELRNESRFEAALRIHSEGLRQAKALGDTIEWVLALNNIDTDYRRVGVLDAAQEYHYSAWKISEEYSDTTSMAKKNRVISLNGLANVYLTLGNYERADSALRMALRGEQELQSDVGQAINYANIGSIFEHRREIDSARLYYQRSMEYNRRAKNDLGISLCHSYLGSLYEIEKQYDKARQEYETAYSMMRSSKDEWHALTSLIALAGIHYATHEEAQAMTYLAQAEEIAKSIKSPEHLSEIHMLYYEIYKRKGDCGAALAAYEEAMAQRDNMMDIEKVNRIQNTGLNIERNIQEAQMQAAQRTLEKERMQRRVGFTILGGGFILLAGLVLILLYLSRLRQRNHQALKSMSRMRETFFTNITHEFRTPLTLILGMSHDLQTKQHNSAEIEAMGQVIERQGKGLLTLINQLLDISKIESSVGNPDWRNGDIIPYIAMIVESYQDYAHSRQITLTYHSDGQVVMDFVPDYVVKVLNNLLSNALKFTPSNGSIKVSAHRVEENLHIEVADTGIGMDSETVAHIFEPFYQGAKESYTLGSGVGLALVKQIMGAIGGSAIVESKLGEGTVFHLSIPIHNDCRQLLSSEESVNNPTLPEEIDSLHEDRDQDNQDNHEYDYRLLVIEDNYDVATYIGSQLSDKYAVTYATNGADGLHMAIEEVPDMIITDLMMPGMDGLELCRQVRSNEIVNHIPVIIISARITEEDRIMGIKAGADTYLTKPFNSDELRTQVENLLERRRLLQKKYTQAWEGEELTTVYTSPEESQLSQQTETTETNTDLSAEIALDRSETDLQFLTHVSQAVFDLLEKKEAATVLQLAASLGMSTSQLYRKMIAIAGYPPGTLIQGVKIRKAMELLKCDHSLSFSEISTLCGFDTYSSFLRAFKAVSKMTPSEYKEQIAPAS